MCEPVWANLPHKTALSAVRLVVRSGGVSTAGEWMRPARVWVRARSLLVSKTTGRNRRRLITLCSSTNQTTSKTVASRSTNDQQNVRSYKSWIGALVRDIEIVVILRLAHIITILTIMSKLLLGFNIFTVLGAYFLYRSGVRLYLDDGYDVLPPSVLRAREYTPPAVEQEPISIPTSSQPPDPVSPSSPWGGSGAKKNYTCTNLRMRPKFLSYDPIMVYIEDFMSPYETQHLKTLACVVFIPHSVLPPYAEFPL